MRQTLLQSLSLGDCRQTLFTRHNLDAIFIYADRYEGFAMAAACSHLNIPICHIEGGDINGGAFDDNIRHAITKLSICILHLMLTLPKVLFIRRALAYSECWITPLLDGLTTGLLDLDQPNHSFHLRMK